MLYLCSGNHLEILADQLASDITQPAENILEPELIVVPGPAFGRWLSLRLAYQQGVCANMAWRSPAELIWFLFQTALPDVPITNIFSPDVLVWRVFDVLSDDGFVGDHRPLLHYLSSGDPKQRWQLAKKLANLYEQYLIYRPDWVLDWEQREAKHWQASLWKKLVGRGNNRHWLTLQREMLKALVEDSSISNRLPQRISLFAVSTLSMTCLELLQALSKHVDVVIYHQNFSKGFWAEILTSKDRRRLLSIDGDNYLENGNQLLATMGRQGREQLVGLMQLEGSEKEVFVSPSSKGLLGCIQRDIFELKERCNKERFELGCGDNSLRIHVCHGAMREVEVLHDQLLDILQTDQSLSTADILVLIPEINTYAPYVEAVFGSAFGDRYVPWRIIGAGLDAHSSLIEVFFSLLDLPLGRFEADKITTLLEQRALQRQFGFLEADRETIERWVRELGIAWGADESEVNKLNFSSRSQHTWGAGTDRLLLGHALGNGDTPFLGILPTLELDGEEAELIGRLRTFLEQLIVLREDLKSPRSMREWIEFGHQILDGFFRFEGEDEVTQLQVYLGEVSRTVSASKHNGKTSLAVFKEALKDRISKKNSGQFMSGAVTFAALSHGQIVPAEVICIVGLNNDSFPRRVAQQSFDKIRVNPRNGDRRSRDEDRYVFLEGMLSARRKLYFSYVGRDARDDTENLPSVLLSELIDFIDKTCRAAGRVSASDSVITHHPLQSFSARYFKGEGNLFSYMAELMPLTEPGAQRPHPLLSKNLPSLKNEPLFLETLAQFFSNPARMLLRGRLGIHLERPRTKLSNREQVSIDRFEAHGLAEMLLRAQLKGESYGIITERLRSAGDIPIGTPGDIFLQKKWQETSKLASRLMSMLSHVDESDITLDGVVNGICLQGRLDNVADEGLIGYSASKLRPYELLRFWILHLALDALAGKSKRATRILIPGRTLILSPVNNAYELLQDLVSLYTEGMTRVLAFFPRSSWAYITANNNADIAAQKEWYGSDYKVGEGNNMYYQLAFRDNLDHVLLGEFQVIARTIYGSLHAHLLQEETFF